MFTRSNCTSWTTAHVSPVKIVKQARPAPFALCQTYRARDLWPTSMPPARRPMPARSAIRWQNPSAAVAKPAPKSPAGEHPARSDVARRDSYLHFPRPAGNDPRPGKSARVPSISGQKPLLLNDKPRSARRGPPVAGSGARAMFLSNIYIKFSLAYNYLIKQYIIP